MDESNLNGNGTQSKDDICSGRPVCPYCCYSINSIRKHYRRCEKRPQNVNFASYQHAVIEAANKLHSNAVVERVLLDRLASIKGKEKRLLALEAALKAMGHVILEEPLHPNGEEVEFVDGDLDQQESAIRSSTPNPNGEDEMEFVDGELIQRASSIRNSTPNPSAENEIERNEDGRRRRASALEHEGALEDSEFERTVSVNEM